MTKAPKLTLKDRIPGTKYTVEDLCRARKLHEDVVWEPGMITTVDGAHQRRHLVVSVTDMGLQSHNYYAEERQTYEIVLQYLGEFYADNRFKLAPRQVRNQRTLHVPAGAPPHGRLGSTVLVQPVGSSKPVKVPKPPKPPKPKPYAPVWATQSATLRGTPRAPEAVLDSFRIRPPCSQPITNLTPKKDSTQC